MFLLLLVLVVELMRAAGGSSSLRRSSSSVTAIRLHGDSASKSSLCRNAVTPITTLVLISSAAVFALHVRNNSSPSFPTIPIYFMLLYIFHLFLLLFMSPGSFPPSFCCSKLVFSDFSVLDLGVWFDLIRPISCQFPGSVHWLNSTILGVTDRERTNGVWFSFFDADLFF